MAANPDISAIRAALKEHMRRTKMTWLLTSWQAELGFRVRDLLHTVTDPRIGTLFKLAHALDIAPETLLGRRVEVCGLITDNGEILPVAEGNGEPQTMPRPPETGGELLAYHHGHR